MEKRKTGGSTISPQSFKAPRTSKPISGITVEDRTAKRQAAGSVLAEETIGKGLDCPEIGDTALSAIYSVDRIGSDSALGQVFKIGFRDHPNVFCALKVMPHITYQTDLVNAREIAFMNTVSNLVTSGVSPFFPALYGSGTCPDIHLAPPTEEQRKEKARSVELYIRANNWKLIKAMIQTYIPHERSREFGKTFWDWDPYSVARFVSDNVQETIMGNLTAPVMGEVVFMELAWGDLEKYMEDPVVPDVRMLIRNVIRAIVDLQTHANLVHGDLHLGNVLIQMIRTDDGQLLPLPLLTDYGHSRELDPENRKEAIFDVEYFMQALGTKSSRLFAGLSWKVKEFNKKMMSTNPYISMREVVYFWDNSFFDASSRASAEEGETGDVWSNFLT